MQKALTAIGIAKHRPGRARREIPDAKCPGLYLVIQPSGTKTWAFRYRFAGKPKKLTLGPVYEGSEELPNAEIDRPNTLAGARLLASEASQKVALGIDPARDKKHQKVQARLRAEQAELLDRDTIEAVAKAFVERYLKPRRKQRHWVETARLLGLKPDPSNPAKLVLTTNARADGKTVSGNWVLGEWRAKSIHEVTRRDVKDLLNKIVAAGSPLAANRVLSAISKMFAWAVEQDILAASPCVSVKPPSEERSRDRVLSDDEIRLVWRAAGKLGWPFGDITKLLILTLQRRDEVAGLRRSEIRSTDRIWQIPGARTKNGEAHDVSLVDDAWSLIEASPKISGSDFVFTVTGKSKVSGFSRAKRRLDDQILKLLKEETSANGGAEKDVKPLPHWTFHDLRRTGATGMARLGVQLPVIEKVLNHTSGSFRGVVGVYQRHSFVDEKRKALETWARLVQSIVSK